MLRGGDNGLLMQNDGGLERRSNFEWLSGLIRTVADFPVNDIPALPFPAFEMASGYFLRGYSNPCATDVRRQARSRVWLRHRT